MVNIYGSGGGGITSDDVTASKTDVLQGVSTVTKDSNGEVVEGTIPKMNATTYYANINDQTINSGVYLNEPLTIKGVSQENLTSENIKPGVTVKIKSDIANVLQVTGNMSSIGSTNYYATANNQTIISPGKYISGNQVINAVSQTNLAPENIKNGVTIKISNGRSNIFAATGNYTGTKHAMSAKAWHGFALSGSDNQDEEEKSFTMPKNGVVYYGGVSTFYNDIGNGTCEIYKNSQLIDSRNGGQGYAVRGGMVDKSFNASAGDVIKIKATASSGSATLCMIQAVCIY